MNPRMRLQERIKSIATLDAYFLKPDEITGKRYALAKTVNKYGAIEVKLPFRSVKEFDAYLDGLEQGLKGDIE